MIVTIARQVIKPACINRYHVLAHELAAASRAESGCISYQLVRAEDENDVHLFIECWRDQAAIDFHCATEHFTRIVPQFTDMFAADEVVTRYHVIG